MINELPTTHLSYQPEKHLWAAVLASYVEDVIRYAKGKRPACRATNYELQQAYEDFKGKQATLARLCGYCDLELEWVKKRIEDNLQ